MLFVLNFLTIKKLLDSILAAFFLIFSIDLWNERNASPSNVSDHCWMRWAQSRRSVTV